MEKRYIGIDLHRNRFTCCIRLENERTYVTEWELEDLGKLVRKLRPSDEVAVEITGNTRLFYDAVVEHVARVVVVNTNQFRVICQSVKKTDPHDARALALYLSKDMLPEVRMKDKELAQLASRAQKAQADFAAGRLGDGGNRRSSWLGAHLGGDSARRHRRARQQGSARLRRRTRHAGGGALWRDLVAGRQRAQCNLAMLRSRARRYHRTDHSDGERGTVS